jgi:hypothetical protein
MKVSGISTGFPVLSRSSGQVPHVLLTRSPLSTRASPGFSFDLHVLGAPPAFVLSQDQTLHRDFNLAGEPARHEIGEPPGSGPLSPFRLACTAAPEGVSPCGIDDDVSRDTPALAFGVTVPFSRSHHSTPGRPQPFGCAVPRAPSRHSLLPPRFLPSFRSGRGRQERPCQSTWEKSPGRTGHTTAWRSDLQAGAGGFSPVPRYSRRPWDRAG